MAETPTWVAPIPSPLVVYPSGLAPDFAFVLGSLASASSTSWGVSGGTSPTIQSGQGEQLGYTVRFQPAATTAMILTGIVPAPHLKAHTSASAQMAFYARAKCTSAGSNTAFTVVLDYYDSSSVLISSESAKTLFTCGTTLPADSTWYVKRIQFTPTIPSNVSQVKITIGYQTGSNTNTTYIDWFAAGFECNFGDFGPHQLGAFVGKQLSITKKFDRTQNVADDGSIDTNQFSSGLYSVKFTTTTFDNGGLVKYRYFHDYCSTRCPFMFFRSVTDVSRDFVEFLSLEQEDDGIERIKGTEYYTATVKASEVRV